MMRKLWSNKRFRGFEAQVDGEPHDKPKPTVQLIIMAGKIDVCLRMTARKATQLADRLRAEVEWSEKLLALTGKERVDWIDKKYRTKVRKP